MMRIQAIFAALLLILFCSGCDLLGEEFETGLVSFDSQQSDDSRPVRRILFIGNSHTYFHGMPDMVRKLADSAQVKERYAITMYAQPAVWLKAQWYDEQVKMLLQKPWDDVVIQADGAEPIEAEWKKDFMQYGTIMLYKAKAKGARVYLYVPWRYKEGIDFYKGNPDLPYLMYSRIQQGNKELALRAGAELVNVGRANMRLLQARPDFPFYLPDGNHGTLQAYYMAALLFFQHFSGKPASETHYVPNGVTAEQDRILKSLVENER